jgi:hypothetical protein
LIEYRTVRETKNIKLVEFVQCDRCKKKFEPTDMEAQEFFRIQKSCGYGSVFGDETTVETEICQYCAKELLGQYLRIVEDE